MKHHFSVTLKNTLPVLLSTFLLFNSSCQSTTEAQSIQNAVRTDLTTENIPPTKPALNEKPGGKPATAAEILAREQVPILCYHQIRNWKASDSKAAKDYIVPIAEFKAQLKMLADSGYHTILPDQLFSYLKYGTELPSKPIMLTYDDTVVDQYSIAEAEMKKYGFKGVFFIMTVSLGRPNYMSKAQVKSLSDEGHIIGSHTWDHHNVKKYQGEDWVTQIEKPTKTLEEITGKEIKYFAYPFGLWNPEAIPQLKKRGFDGAFVLAEKRDEKDPLFTIRRIIASGYWSPKTLHNSIVNSFDGK
jgi:peptidoglycan/xylan/chitin deacetylase (PgdA/CDA1 family)